MEAVKKSFNMPGDLAQMVDDFIRENPGVSFTLLMNQAIAAWLKNPQVALKKPAGLSDADVDRFMEQNRELMDDLSK